MSKKSAQKMYGDPDVYVRQHQLETVEKNANATAKVLSELLNKEVHGLLAIQEMTACHEEESLFCWQVHLGPPDIINVDTLSEQCVFMTSNFLHGENVSTAQQGFDPGGFCDRKGCGLAFAAIGSSPKTNEALALATALQLNFISLDFAKRVTAISGNKLFSELIHKL